MQFLGAVALVGYVVLRTVEDGGKAAIKRLKSKEKATENTYVVHTQGMSNEGLRFLIGEQFRVLEIVGDAVLIEKIGYRNYIFVYFGYFRNRMDNRHSPYCFETQSIQSKMIT